jgi:hypothetical protein
MGPLIKELASHEQAAVLSAASRPGLDRDSDLNKMPTGEGAAADCSEGNETIGPSGLASTRGPQDTGMVPAGAN